MTVPVERMTKLGVLAVLEEVAEERDELRDAWESCTATISELRAERDDAIRDNRKLRARVRALEDMVDRYAK
jgi:uncharacterized coiled-coil DUF342 family protein